MNMNMQMSTNTIQSVNLFRTKKYGKWGFENKQGNVVIPCRWKYAYEFSDGLAYVEDLIIIFISIQKVLWLLSVSFRGLILL